MSASDRRPAGALRRRLDRPPPGWRRSVVRLLAVGLLGAAYLLTVWLLSLTGDDPADWVGPLPHVLAGFAAGLIGARIRRRRLGGADRAREYDRALRTGRLPEGADPAVWRPLLERELQPSGGGAVSSPSA